LALGACIEAFPHCRPVICIDGTFLTGRYKGTILTAVAADGNTQLLPLAIAFVEKESGDTWYWFLQRVKQMIVKNVEKVCLIHDQHKGILQAIDDIQNGSTERSRTALWPDLKSRWCMRHMGANFHTQFKNKILMKLFKRLCSQNQERKFNFLWKKLDELTKKQTAELAKRSVNTEEDDQVSLEDVGLDGPNVRRKRRRAIKTFSEWIEHEPKEKWALLFDEGGARYGLMTTNLAEVYNWVLRGVRSLPLVGIVEFFLYRTCEYFRDRYAVAQKDMVDNRKVYGYKVTKYMDAAFKKARLHRVTPVGSMERRYEVMCRDKGRMGGRREKHVQECVLRPDACICSCHKPKLLHLPCTHVIAACFEAGGLQARMYVSNYFMKETIWMTWRHEIYGFRILGDFITDPGHNATYIPDPDPEMFQGVGRRKKKRIRNNMDRSEAGRDVRLCSKCHETGHTYKDCTALSYGSRTDGAGPSEAAPNPATQATGRRARRPNNEGLM